MLLCCCVVVLLCYCVVVMLCYCVVVMLCYCVVVLLCYCVVVLLCCCVIVLLCYCVVVLLCYCVIVLLCCCDVVLFNIFVSHQQCVNFPIFEFKLASVGWICSKSIGKKLYSDQKYIPSPSPAKGEKVSPPPLLDKFPFTPNLP